MTRPASYAFDQLFLTREQLRALTEQLPTPFYLYDEAGLRASIGRWRQAFSWNAGYRTVLPLCKLPFAAAAAILREEGCAVSCQDLQELQAAARWGFPGGRIVYAPMWPDAACMRLAQNLGAAVAVDHPAAASMCLEYPVETVSLCCNPGGKFRVGASTVLRADSIKRGMTQRQILEWAPVLVRSGVKRLGLEAHLAAQTTDSGYYAAVAETLYALTAELRRLWAPVSFCNLGGGPGLGFLAGMPDADPEAMSEAVRQVSADREMDLCAEQDRMICGPNAILVMRVLGVKQAHRRFVIVDADAAQFPRMLQKSSHHISLLSSDATHDRSYCDVVGCRTDCRASFAERKMLPPVQERDCCILHDAGVDPPGTGCGAYLWRSDGTVVALGGLND